MDNLGKLYSIKLRIQNALYETIIPSPMVDDVKLRGLHSSVVEHLQLAPPASYLIGHFSKEVELLSTEEYLPHTASSASQKEQPMDIEVCNLYHEPKGNK